MIVDHAQNKKTAFTRMCIGEAIASLLDQTSIEKMKVSDIAKKAGVARMTFYKYYDSPITALKDYLAIVISNFMEANDKEFGEIRFMEYEHILFSLNFYDQYADFFLKLYHHHLSWILMDGINQFMAEHAHPERPLSVYVMYSYCGSLLNTFLLWEDNGKKDSAEDVAKTLYRLYNSDRIWG